MPLPPPARYFPVKPTPLRMEAGLLRFGTDLGNGAADRLFFQVDDELERYLVAKRAATASRHAVLARDDAEVRVHATVLAWLRETLGREHPERLAAAAADASRDLATGPEATAYAAIARTVQEDLVVIRRLPDGSSSAIMVDVAIPSGWRPERIHGASFGTIHGPVPAFAKDHRAERSMLDAMVDRGPYVRFVWTVNADDHLDHHPEEGRRLPWTRDASGFLRVERQVTVPFTACDASLFLIRVYVYPFSSLTPEQRDVLARAIEAMPDEIAAYKSLAASRGVVLDVLRRSGPAV